MVMVVESVKGSAVSVVGDELGCSADYARP